MGLVYDTSTWADRLWQGHVDRFPSAQQLMREGTVRQRQYPRFAEDVHSLLYLRHAPPKQTKPTPPEWAESLTKASQELAEWPALKSRCARNGFAAGVATETILQALLPQVPEQSQRGKRPSPPPSPPPGWDLSSGAGVVGDDQASAQRRALRQAIREASQAVDAAEAALEGCAESFSLSQGVGEGQAESLKDLDTIRDLYSVLAQDATMQRIAALAGRLQRLGSTHKRCTVTPGVGCIKGLTMGWDLDRILPSELAGLRSTHRLHRLQTLGRIMNKRALQYLMQGEHPETRGPIIFCLDESRSMDGEPAELSKAIALALLTTATQQKRALYLIGFSSGPKEDRDGPQAIRHEEHIPPGQVTMDLLSAILRRGCSGGTSFTAPLRRALEILVSVPTMKQADIVFLTDGRADLDPTIAEAILKAKKAQSLHLYAIAIGVKAKLATLAPIASAQYHLSAQPVDDSAQLAPVLAQIAS